MIDQEKLFQEIVREIEGLIAEQTRLLGSPLPTAVIIHDKVQQNWYSINNRPEFVARLREHFGVTGADISGYINLPRL